LGQFDAWVRADGTGKGFDSSAGFTLPTGAKRSPDCSWIRLLRWEALTPAQRRRFAPICPDFVVELRSPSDSLDVLKGKMEEYLENGALLGWLIDPAKRKVRVYRPGQPAVCLEDPARIAGDPVLPGFVLDLAEVWD
jgi:Uma2 family endonuclease